MRRWWMRPPPFTTIRSSAPSAVRGRNILVQGICPTNTANAPMRLSMCPTRGESPIQFQRMMWPLQKPHMFPPRGSHPPLPAIPPSLL
jgi:hypothetical protein